MDNNNPEVCNYKRHQMNNIKRLTFMLITYTLIMLIGIATAIHSKQFEPIYMGFVCSMIIFWLAGLFNPKVWRYGNK